MLVAGGLCRGGGRDEPVPVKGPRRCWDCWRYMGLMEYVLRLGVEGALLEIQRLS